MRFEKWQALGNDYLIFEEAELTPAQVPGCATRTSAPAPTACSLLTKPDEPGFVARLRIFNPDGSEAELSGNGAREAIMYLRRNGWTEADTFSIQTLGGRDPARRSPARRPAASTWAAPRCNRPTIPAARPTDGARSAGHRFQHVAIGNPQCAIRVAGPSTRLDLNALGPEIENAPIFPNRTNVSFWKELAPDAIRARIFERGVGETLSSGTGASGAAVAHVVRGGDSPVTVHLDGGELTVDVDESLHVDLTGWAVPIYRGELSEEFVNDLREAD